MPSTPQQKPSEPVNIDAATAAISKVGTIAVGILALLLMFWLMSPSTPETALEIEERQESEREGKAFGCARQEIEAMLKSPSSLQFQFGTIRVREFSDHHFSISGEFDAQNGFGAMLRQSFQCSAMTTDSNECIETSCTIL